MCLTACQSRNHEITTFEMSSSVILFIYKVVNGLDSPLKRLI